MANRFISSLCIIALVFALSVAFTTNSKAAEVEINLDEFPYRTYGYNLPGSGFEGYTVYISDTEITTNYPYYYDRYNYFIDLNDGTYITTDTFDNGGSFYLVMSNNLSPARVYCLTYINGKWEVSYPYYACYYGFSMGDRELFSETLPDDFPEIELPESITVEDINKIVDDRLNATTTTTEEVTVINQNITNTYTSYQAGDITYTTVNENITQYITELNDLNQIEGNTLTDAININNSLTYAQTVQDVAAKDEIIDQMQVSKNVAAQVTGYTNQATNTYNSYDSGDLTQTETINQLNQYITYLTNLITPESSVADIDAINTGINTINGIKDSVADHSDLDADISESVQKSNEEEKEYLESLIDETTSSMQDMSAENQFSDQEKSEANNILGLIWDNEIIKRLLPISAIFMVVCVALGIKYEL